MFKKNCINTTKNAEKTFKINILIGKIKIKRPKINVLMNMPVKPTIKNDIALIAILSFNLKFKFRFKIKLEVIPNVTLITLAMKKSKYLTSKVKTKKSIDAENKPINAYKTNFLCFE